MITSALVWGFRQYWLITTMIERTLEVAGGGKIRLRKLPSTDAITDGNIQLEHII